MTKADKKKLCWNCEGNVDKEAVQCQYCGVMLTPTYEDEEAETASKTSEYAIGTGIPQPPYATQNSLQDDINSVNQEFSAAGGLQKQSSMISIPFTLLLCGVVLFLFSFMLIFFSKNGILTLKWDASYWFVYMLISAPLLFFGWKLLKPREEEL